MKKILLLCYVLLVSLLLSAQCEPATTYSATAKVISAPPVGVASPKAVFKVGDTKYVYFAHGNLRYQGSTGKWRFADNQYDFVGNASNNTSPSETSANWRDLLGWGTGSAPIKSTSNNADYATYVEWGSNAIENGGNTPNVWRAPTIAEWVYLFTSRPNASYKYGFGQVNSKNGIILLPDNWELPLELTFKSSAEQTGYNTNVYDIYQWALMEKRGAVFLPACGNRNGTTLLNGSSYVWGYYWSSTNSGSDQAMRIRFGDTAVDPSVALDRYQGIFVRLVADKQ